MRLSSRLFKTHQTSSFFIGETLVYTFADITLRNSAGRTAVRKI